MKGYNPLASRTHRIVAGALSATIDAHGPIDRSQIGSVAKRVAAQLSAFGVDDAYDAAFAALKRLAPDTPDETLHTLSAVAVNAAQPYIEAVLLSQPAEAVHSPAPEAT